jgi:tryptophanyl-tRNA synthetase
MKAHYVRGGLGDSIVKKRLEVVLQECWRRSAPAAKLAKDKGYIMQMLKEGTFKARSGSRTADEVKSALGLITSNHHRQQQTDAPCRSG